MTKEEYEAEIGKIIGVVNSSALNKVQGVLAEDRAKDWVKPEDLMAVDAVGEMKQSMARVLNYHLLLLYQIRKQKKLDLQQEALRVEIMDDMVDSTTPIMYAIQDEVQRQEEGKNERS